MRAPIMLIVLALSPEAYSDARTLLECRMQEGPAERLTLSKELESIYARAALTHAMPVETILGPLVGSYRYKDYDDERLRGVLTTMASVASERVAADVIESWRKTEPTYGPGEQVLILYLDPTCPDCASFIERVRRMVKTCPAFPKIAIRPAFHDAVSEDLAVAMELIREQMPDQYIEAAFAFVDAISRQPSAWREIVEPYLAIDAIRSPNAERVRKQLAAEAKQLDTLHVYAPAALYRGRLLLRCAPKDGEPFDPLRDDTNLVTVIAIIDGLDGDTTK